MKQINVVFQGGGVRGIAHVGVLRKLAQQKDIQIVGVGGSSVGAIIASLLAAGYNAHEIEQKLRDRPLHTLIQSRMTLKEMTSELFAVGNEIKQALEESKTLMGKWTLARSLRARIEKFQRLTLSMQDLFTNFGLFDSKDIVDWLSDLLNKKHVVTIEDLFKDASKTIKKFRILVSNVTNSAYREINETHSSESVADVVGQSISIPIFFKPYRTAAMCYVDGGMLSNYPLWLFQDSDDPTLGVRLQSKSDESLIRPINNFADYIMGLLWTMVGAHDKFRGIPANCHALNVPTGDIESTDFELNEQQIVKLLDDGEIAAGKVEWALLKPGKVSFKESQSAAQNVLDDTIESAFSFCMGAADGTDTEVIKYEKTLKIERDGTARREIVMELKNLGDTPIIQTPYGISELPTPRSFLDLNFYAEDITPGKPPQQTVKILPIMNRATEKHIAVLFVPPILKNQSRTIKYGCQANSRYQNTLFYRKSEEEGLNLMVSPNSKGIYRRIVFRIWLDQELGELVCNELSPHSDPSISRKPTDKYEEHSWEFSNLTGINFQVEFHLKE